MARLDWQREEILSDMDPEGKRFQDRDLCANRVGGTALAPSPRVTVTVFVDRSDGAIEMEMERK